MLTAYQWLKLHSLLARLESAYVLLGILFLLSI